MAERGPIFVRLELRGTIGEPTLLSRIVACDDAISSAAGIKDPTLALKTMTEERNLLMQENHRLKGELEATTRKAREVNERLDRFLGEGPKVQEEVDRRVTLLAIHPYSRTEDMGPEVIAYLVILCGNGAVQTYRVGVVETKVQGVAVPCVNGERALIDGLVDVRMRRNLYAAVGRRHQGEAVELPLVLGEEDNKE